MKPEQFQKLVLSWFRLHGRKDLPWQQNKTPYRVWVSEIMLQQTQVSTVIPYFLRFMERFPNLLALTKSSEEDVLHLWTGLGYYSRARNLFRTAKIIQENFAGNFPFEQNELENLPGIGRSTAGAIRAIAFGKPATILDGNVKRVLTRFYAIQKWPGDKNALDELWSLAEKLTPKKAVADYTQAMMDIGATVCVRGQPVCQKCPLQSDCVAYKSGIEKKLPLPKPRKILPIKEVALLILKNKEQVLLEKRPSNGIWGGLWSLPELAGKPSMDDIHTKCLSKKVTIQTIQPAEPFRHTFSHFHLDISPILISIKKPKIMEGKAQIWYNLREPPKLGLPAPIKSILSKLL